MTLREFLYEKHMTMRDLSEILGYSEGYVSQVIRGVMTPGKMFVYHVEKFTEGMITEEKIKDRISTKKVKNLVA